jgi:hypothetical protein
LKFKSEKFIYDLLKEHYSDLCEDFYYVVYELFDVEYHSDDEDCEMTDCTTTVVDCSYDSQASSEMLD